MKIKRPKGALPIPYIVALIIAIIVIAVLIYWFMIMGGKPIEEFERQRCNARAATYCSLWAPTGYTFDNDGNPSIVGKWEDDVLGGKDCAKNNILTAVSKTYCETILGVKK